MKIILSIIIALAAHTALAVEFKCNKQLSPEKSISAWVSSWPDLVAQVSHLMCTSSGGISKCSTSIATVATTRSVCYRPFDIKKDCTIGENATALVVTCVQGSKIEMTFNVDATSQGTLSCYEDGILRKTWNVGTCVAE